MLIDKILINIIHAIKKRIGSQRGVFALEGTSIPVIQIYPSRRRGPKVMVSAHAMQKKIAANCNDKTPIASTVERITPAPAAVPPVRGLRR